MALAQVLSAIRQLILDDRTLPDDAHARRARLRTQFSELSDTEIADLAAIPPARLRVYSDLVYAGERSVLRWAFPMTFAAIRQLRAGGMGLYSDPCGSATHGSEYRPMPPSDDEVEFEIIHELHRYRSWQSASTRELAGIFESYVREKLIAAGWGGLRELADYERTDLDVFYAEDDEYRPMKCDDLVRLAELSVGDLMNVSVALATYAHVREYRYDILGIAEQWRADACLPVPLPERESCLAVCGRNGDSLMPRWVALSKMGYVVLNQLKPGLVVRVNDVANGYLGALEAGDGRTEEQLFAVFFGELQEWFRAGVLLRTT